MNKPNKDIVPLLISIVLILISLAVVWSSDYALNPLHYIGIGCLTLSTILYFVAKKIYMYVFGLTLIGGLVGVVDFFYTTYKIGFGEIGVNPIFLILIILFFVFGKDTMNKLFPEKNQTENS